MPDTFLPTRDKAVNKQVPALKTVHFSRSRLTTTKTQKYIICQVAVNAMKKNRAEMVMESVGGGVGAILYGEVMEDLSGEKPP